MDDEVNRPTYELRETLIKLKAETDDLRSLTISNGIDREQTIATYHSNVLPHLLQLRRLNRMSKDKLELKHEKVRQLNRELVNLHDRCENITYEALCLNHEVSVAKKRLSPTKSRIVETKGDAISKMETNGHTDTDFFDAEKVAALDHKTRLEKLDEEEKRRKDLEDKLSRVTTETNEMDSLSKSTETQLNRIKPYIKQLVDRLDHSETT